jgi:molecular chaperone DnaK (HSP70)
MTTHVGLDLGTSNTTICDDRGGTPRVLHLPGLSRLEPLTQTPVVPSCVCIVDGAGEQILIGQEAVDYNWDGRARGWAAGFKRALGRDPSAEMARVGDRRYTARDVARLFVDRLIAAVERTAERPVTDLTIAVPSDAFENYRAELRAAWEALDERGWARRLWDRVRGAPPARRVRFVDEPVAAALGYGVDVAGPTTLVAFDFGAGTMEAALVRTRPGESIRAGHADVLAKQGIRLGGRDVDGWILEALVPTALHDWPEWSVALHWEAERTKLLASAGREGAFTFRNETWGRLDRPGLEALLLRHGLHAEIRGLLGRLLEDAASRHGLAPGDVEHVLLEGGSTLLPGVRETVSEVFGRDRVREWLPFESVARGACLFGAGGRVEDFIYHDYGLRVRRDDGREEYELLIEAGTRFPTPDDHVVRYYAPGFEGQEELNLFVCEVGRVAGRSVAWEERSNGNRYYRPETEGERAFCPCLNEADPALPLDPPGSGTAPRLRVSFMIDSDRWLCATVHDLERKIDLRVREPVVRLL